MLWVLIRSKIWLIYLEYFLLLTNFPVQKIMELIYYTFKNEILGRNASFAIESSLHLEFGDLTDFNKFVKMLDFICSTN